MAQPRWWPNGEVLCLFSHKHPLSLVSSLTGPLWGKAPLLLCGDLGGVGLHSAGQQALYLPSLKTNQRAQRQGPGHQWFNRWWGEAESYKPEERSWSSSPLCPTDARHGSTIYHPREEEATICRRKWCQKGWSITRETSILKAGAFLS